MIYNIEKYSNLMLLVPVTVLSPPDARLAAAAEQSNYKPSRIRMKIS